MPDRNVRVVQLRLAVTAEDYDHALRFYRDVLGMPELGAFASPGSPGGRVTILDAGRATLELADPPYAAYIDEVEVGRRVAGPIRIAFEVADAAAAAGAAEDAGARVLAPPTTTPWNSERAPRSPRGTADHPLRRTRRFGLSARLGQAWLSVPASTCASRRRGCWR